MISIERHSSLTAVYLHTPWLRNWFQKLSPTRDRLLELFFQKLSSWNSDGAVWINSILSDDLNGLQSISHGLKLHHVQASTELEFLMEVGRQLPPSASNDPDWDEVYFSYFRGIAPLLELELVGKMEYRHTQYFSQYSYSENLPVGLVPTFVSREFLATLPASLPGTVHDFFLKNINHYDIDVFFQKPDLRQLRLDFCLTDQRSLKLTEDLTKINSNLPYLEILPTLQKNSNIFRLAPSYIEIELYRGCESQCTFCPRQFGELGFDSVALESDLILKSLKEIDEVSQTGYTVCLGGWGEPLLHPQLTDTIDGILQKNGLQELILETALNASTVDRFFAGLEALHQKYQSSPDFLERWKKFTVIVNLTTMDAKLYKSLQGTQTPLDQVNGYLERLSQFLPKTQIHLQILKILEVEKEIEGYFNHYEKLGYSVIIQKYNRYAGRMPEKRVSDLTPIHREFCWHLARDFYVNADGSVSICRQVPHKTVGNLKDQSLFQIWQKGEKAFTASFLGNHSETGAPCQECDEWYTFQG